MSQAHFSYRPDVDGLRAVAVLAVILYHSGLPFLGGGYVGVDVFFVISGFVITSVVQAELAHGRFSLREFYQRRVRRLFPALFAMIAVSLLIGWFVMMPDDYKRLGQSAVSNALFLSNFYFLKDSGYFGATAAAKPLLHTWSLAVEEQFYLLLPLYLLLLRRLSAQRMRQVTVGVALASLLLAVAATRYEPNASFFLLPTRAWELLVGVLLAQGLVSAPRSERAAAARSLLGLALIAFAALCYSERTPFPGLAALPPVLGAALLISAGGCRAQGWLASRPMVFIGRISYPLYLWHFPLLGFASYLSVEPLGVGALLAVNAAIFACAYVSWRCVEQPLRQRRVFASAKPLFAFGGGCIALTLVCGLAIHLGRGIESRFDGEQLKIVQGMTDRMAGRERCASLDPGQIERGDLCLLGAAGPAASAADTVLWGDSHAEAIAPGIADLAQRSGKPVLFAAQHGCAIGAHLQHAAWQGRFCAAFDAAMQDWLLGSPSVRRVILASRWSALNSRDSAQAAAEALKAVVTRLTAADKEVWLVAPVPDAKARVPQVLYLKSLGLARDFEPRATLDEFSQAQQRSLATLQALARLPRVGLLSPHESLCATGRCAVERDGRPLYFDDNHLTSWGAKLATERFAAVLR